MAGLIVIAAFLLIVLVLSFCFHLVGGILKLALKLLVCVPCAIVIGVLGAVLCCTLIMIPLGMACFKLAGFLLNPFRVCCG
ncbi:MAG: hypothetical protein HFI47_11585 [Lachnospiraceae bacterium]|jgi:hypothetical protein|nr:hypothetical protein [Lachnospiraceae bacterium]